MNPPSPLCGTARAGAEPVTVNGRAALQVGRVWAIAMELAEGENVFTVRQGNEALTLHCTQRTPQFTPVEPEPDGSAPAERGQWLRTTAALTSLLEDPADPSSIAAGLPAGWCAPVGESRRLTKTASTPGPTGWTGPDGCSRPTANCWAGGRNRRFRRAGGICDERRRFWRLRSSDPNTTPLFFAHETPEKCTGDRPNRKTVGNRRRRRDRDGFRRFCVRHPARTRRRAVGLGHSARRQRRPDRAPEGRAASRRRAGRWPGCTFCWTPATAAPTRGLPAAPGRAAPQEKDLNLALALAARTRLTQLGAQVTLTRDGDSTLTLNQRREMLAAQAPDLFLSLHHNSAGFDRDSTDVGGVECYYFTERSAPLARALSQQLGSGTGRTLQGARQDYYYVTRTDLCPAVLLETGFLTSAAEYAACADPETIWAEAGLIAQAVAEVYGRTA